jgi:hypothetical protein
MPAVGTLLFLLDVFLVVHAAKSGRFWPWAYVVLLLPGFGAAAYVLVELVPEWRGSVSGQRAQNQISKAINPTRRYRALKTEAEIAHTIANRAALAEECLALGRNEEALALYSDIIDEPLGDEPAFFVGKARAELGASRPKEALATLETLKVRHPDHNHSDTDLLYARALDEAGRADEAIQRYREVADTYPGPEPAVRLARLLKNTGNAAEARAIAENVVNRGKRSARFVRKRQAEWLTAARSLLKE